MIYALDFDCLFGALYRRRWLANCIASDSQWWNSEHDRTSANIINTKALWQRDITRESCWPWHSRGSFSSSALQIRLAQTMAIWKCFNLFRWLIDFPYKLVAGWDCSDTNQKAKTVWCFCFRLGRSLCRLCVFFVIGNQYVVFCSLWFNKFNCFYIQSLYFDITFRNIPKINRLCSRIIFKYHKLTWFLVLLNSYMKYAVICIDCRWMWSRQRQRGGQENKRHGKSRV